LKQIRASVNGSELLSRRNGRLAVMSANHFFRESIIISQVMCLRLSRPNEKMMDSATVLRQVIHFGPFGLLLQTAAHLPPERPPVDLLHVSSFTRKSAGLLGHAGLMNGKRKMSYSPPPARHKRVWPGLLFCSVIRHLMDRWMQLSLHARPHSADSDKCLPSKIEGENEK
jgi:hypothetical protein